jgi:hypothetical protein
MDRGCVFYQAVPTMRQYLGVGADGERVELEQVHPACWLVHCEGNSQSPFEFETESDARHFASLLWLQRIDEL